MSGALALRLGMSTGIDGSSAPPAMVLDTGRVGTCTSTMTFNTDGTMSTSVTVGGAIFTDTTHNWYTPTTASIGNTHWIQVTPTSGTLSINNLSSFVDISTTRIITVTGVGAVKTCTFTVDISTSSSGTPVVSTQTTNIISADGT